MAKVSVIIPIYKAEAYLRQCLDSVSQQTLTELEIIAVDDGSPDGCGVICDEYARQDRRFRVLHRENGGVVAALLTGLEAARADHVGFVDADDWIDPGYFQCLYEAALATGADMVQAERIEERDPPMALLQPETKLYESPAQLQALTRAYFTQYLYDPFRRPITFSRCDKLYRRALVKADLGLLDGQLYLAEDTVFNAAVLPDCKKVAVLSDTPKYHYRILPGSNSHRYDPREMSRLARLRETLLRIAQVKGTDPALPELYIGHAVYYRAYTAAVQPDADPAAVKAQIRSLLKSVPPELISRYAASRGGAVIRLCCALLRSGAVGPFIRLARLNESRKKP